MAIQMELYELKNLCMEMASLGAANYVKQTIPAKDLISQREAYRLFQECRVKLCRLFASVSPGTLETICMLHVVK